MPPEILELVAAARARHLAAGGDGHSHGCVLNVRARACTCGAIRLYQAVIKAQTHMTRSQLNDLLEEENQEQAQLRGERLTRRNAS